MVSIINSCAVMGIEGLGVQCECDLSNGLPRFDIVGLPDASVKESRERVHAAMKNCDFTFPMKRIIVNLAPGDLRKEGPIYDLPILIGLLCASGQLPQPSKNLCMVGEVSLEGEVRPVSGILSMVLAAQRTGLTAAFVPEANAVEAALAQGITIYPVTHINQIAAHLRGDAPISPAPQAVFAPASPAGGPDFADVMGQQGVKRALEVAAAGGHNVLMLGSPGAGKSMLARRLPGIMPDLTYEEALECTKIYSVAAALSRENPMVVQRPFRSPHHTASTASLAGGGSKPRPGEVSLAHNGILFLDEMPEFSKNALEVLRQPLEDGMLTITRAGGSATYPSRFLLVAAMNPCKCGYYGHPSKRCTCSPRAVQQYRRKISGPLLDRIDLHITVPSVEYESLKNRTPAESSEKVRHRVSCARVIQQQRYAGTDIPCNAHITPDLIGEVCATDEGGQALLGRAFERLGLSARAHDRILKVARTIADLEGAPSIGAEHIGEAIQYRSLDRESLG